MKPEDARKLAERLAASNNYDSDAEVVVEAIAALRTLADQVEVLTKGLRNAQQTLVDIAGDADLAETEAFRALREGGAK